MTQKLRKNSVENKSRSERIDTKRDVKVQALLSLLIQQNDVKQALKKYNKREF